MKKLITLSLLLFIGCEKYAPTDHTHSTTGICVQAETDTDSELNEYKCYKEGEFQIANDAGESSTLIIDEYHCEFQSIQNLFADPNPKPIYHYWFSDSSCEVYCADIISIDTQASCEIILF